MDRLAAVGPHRSGEHPGGRRLAVGRADHGGAVGEAPAEASDGVGLQAQEHAPGKRRTATATAAAAERPDAAGEGDLRAQAAAARFLAHAGTSTRSARGSTVTVAGRSACVVAVRIDRERPVGLDPHLGGAVR